MQREIAHAADRVARSPKNPAMFNRFAQENTRKRHIRKEIVVFFGKVN